MIEGWAAMSVLQKIGAVALAWTALALILVSVWNLLLGAGRNRDEEELREAVQRKLRDDERSGKKGDNDHAD